MGVELYEYAVGGGIGAEPEPSLTPMREALSEADFVVGGGGSYIGWSFSNGDAIVTEFARRATTKEAL